MSGDAQPPIVRIAGVSKSYPGVKAVREVSLDIRRGETLGLVGANGAGKSTLTRLISGGEAPEAGHLEIDGERVALRSAADGLRQGIVLVPQALTVVPNLTVRENLVLGLERNPRRAGRSLPDDLRDVTGRLGLDVDLDAQAGGLSPAVLKLLMIGAGMLRQPRVLILDEPTAILAGAEVDRLFTIVRALREAGQTIIYISHRLPEIIALADRVAVMRGGRLVGTEEGKATNAGQLASLMVGSVVEQPRRPELAVKAEAAPVLLEVDGLARHPKVKPTSLTVHAGEIVGLAGLVGAGRTSLIRTICGIEAPDAGRVLVGGEEATPRSVKQAIAAGIAHIPEDRARLAIVPRLTVAENVLLPDARGGRALPWLPVITPRRQRALVAETLASLNIEPAHAAGLPAGGLSGGNQQKVVLARWLMRNARVYVFDEPTEGIDIAARAQVHALIRELAARGVGVLLSSSDVEEVALMSDRVLVMRQGAIAAELAREEISETAIGLASLGHVAA
jgi:ABC-type sugar transport system ATPase subunit